MRMDAFFHTLSRQRLFPEAMLRICPGYLPANNAEPVARARRFAPPRERCAMRLISRRRCCISVRATDAKKPAR
ncbi:hypothetical protein FML22_00990 [Klebsiella oxytoca]|nr:hypothetical protein [Klebsiella oxytoca]